MGAKNPGSLTYDYPRPALTADVVVVSRDARPHVLLIKRKYEPFAGSWALPGGFVDENERPADAAVRELKEETGIGVTDLEHLYTAGAGQAGAGPRGGTAGTPPGDGADGAAGGKPEDVIDVEFEEKK